ncbi:Bardet-Biedl syndrome 4 protein [Dinochytrium kinnereticum]|nr:Bardet-Biedl syndrome 4 protein [Dinochytrium kinnereticum]
MDAVEWRIHYLYVTGQHDECLALIAAVNGGGEGSRSSGYGLLVRGLISRSAGDISDAYAVGEEYAKIDPTNVQNLKSMARCLYLRHRIKDALQLYDEALKYAGHDWEIYHNKAICLCLLADYNGAEEFFRKALSIHAHESTFGHLGKMLLTLDKPDLAAEIYREGLRVNPENVDYLSRLGIISLKKNDIPKAMDYLGRALSYDPRNVKAIVGVGTILQRGGDYDGALVKYRTAILLSPESPKLWNNIGLCFVGKGKAVAAISCLKHASYLDPFNSKIASNLALSYLQAGQYASGAVFLKSSNTLDPTTDVSDWLNSVGKKLDPSTASKPARHSQSER